MTNILFTVIMVISTNHFTHMVPNKDGITCTPIYTMDTNYVLMANIDGASRGVILKDISLDGCGTNAVDVLSHQAPTFDGSAIFNSLGSWVAYIVLAVLAGMLVGAFILMFRFIFHLY